MKKRFEDISVRQIKWNFTNVVNIFNKQVENELVDEDIGEIIMQFLTLLNTELNRLKENFKEDQALEFLKTVIQFKLMLLNKWKEPKGNDKE